MKAASRLLFQTLSIFYESRSRCFHQGRGLVSPGAKQTHTDRLLKLFKQTTASLISDDSVSHMNLVLCMCLMYYAFVFDYFVWQIAKVYSNLYSISRALVGH